MKKELWILIFFISIAGFFFVREMNVFLRIFLGIAYLISGFKMFFPPTECLKI